MTLTGMTTEQVVELFKEKLEPEAYSEVAHMSYLTEIDPAYLREALTTAFGLCGFGWFYEYETEDLDIRPAAKEGRWIATMKKFALHFRYVEGDPSNGGVEVKISDPILSAGSSTNNDPGNAIKGAITNSLSKAGAMLLWQLDVYKGKLTHKTAGLRTEIKKKGNGNDAKKKDYEASLLQIRSNAITSPEEFGSREFWKITNSLGVDGPTGTAILKECSDSWADAAVSVIDSYGGIEIEKNENEKRQNERRVVDEVPF
jgi:hypothetical protein